MASEQEFEHVTPTSISFKCTECVLSLLGVFTSNQFCHFNDVFIMLIMWVVFAVKLSLTFPSSHAVLLSFAVSLAVQTHVYVQIYLGELIKGLEVDIFLTLFDCL